jgi:hypothetical protein
VTTPIPPNNTQPGDPLHILYHNQISNALTAVSGGGTVLPSGDTTGATDTANIAAALNTAPLGQPITLRPAVYYTNAPLIMPSGSALISAGRTFAVPTGNYGNGGLPLTGAIIRPAAAFSGTSIISLGNAPVAQAGGQYIKGITLDGSQLPSSSAVTGIQAVGWVAGVTLREVTVWSGGGTGQMLGPGIDVRADGSGHAPDFWDIAHCKVSAINGIGINFAGLADSYILNTEATGNHGDNWNITNCGNSRFIGCKGEGSGTGFGWNLTGASAFTGYVQFIGCTSSVNSSGGWNLTGTGTGRYRWTDTDATDTTPYTITSTNANTVQFAPPDVISEYGPADSGFVAWSFDPALVGGLNTVLVSGTIYLTGVQVRKPSLATGIRFFQTVAASGLTGGQCFVGLLNSAGTVVGVSADQSGAWGGTTTIVDAALAGGPFMIQPGLYWVAILANGTTPPGVGRLSIENVTLANGRNAAATSRFATNGTAQTSITNRTPSANTASFQTLWVAVY